MHRILHRILHKMHRRHLSALPSHFGDSADDVDVTLTSCIASGRYRERVAAGLIFVDRETIRLVSLLQDAHRLAVAPLFLVVRWRSAIARRAYVSRAGRRRHFLFVKKCFDALPPVFECFNALTAVFERFSSAFGDGIEPQPVFAFCSSVKECFDALPPAVERFSSVFGRPALAR